MDEEPEATVVVDGAGGAVVAETPLVLAVETTDCVVSVVAASIEDAAVLTCVDREEVAPPVLVDFAGREDVVSGGGVVVDFEPEGL